MSGFGALSGAECDLRSVAAREWRPVGARNAPYQSPGEYLVRLRVRWRSTTERLFCMITWTTPHPTVHDRPTGRGQRGLERGQPGPRAWTHRGQPAAPPIATSSGRHQNRTTTSCVRGLTPDPIRSTVEPRAEPIRAPTKRPAPAVSAGPGTAPATPNGPRRTIEPQLPREERGRAPRQGAERMVEDEARWPEPAARRPRSWIETRPPGPSEPLPPPPAS